MAAPENTPIVISLTLDELTAREIAEKAQDTFVKSEKLVLCFGSESVIGGKIVEFLHDLTSRRIDIYMNHHILHINY